MEQWNKGRMSRMGYALAYMKGLRQQVRERVQDVGREEHSNVYRLSQQPEMTSHRLALLGLTLFCSTRCAGFLNPAADSAISVHGKVANVQADATCNLNLFTADGRAKGKLTVKPAFTRSFVVAPGSRGYYVEISCRGQSGGFRSETYELGGETKTLDLGSILLK
jgi:hypothetical protein